MSTSSMSTPPEPGQRTERGMTTERREGLEPTGPAEPQGTVNWALLVLGALVVLYGLLVISMRPVALGFLAVMAGIAFIVAGVAQFGIAARLTGAWRWLGFLGGAVGLAAGIATFIWPGVTLYVIAVIAAWLFVINGVVRIVNSIAYRARELWWLGLLVGVAELLLGLWAIGSPSREVFLLVNLIGIFLVVAGFDAIVSSLAERAQVSGHAKQRA